MRKALTISSSGVALDVGIPAFVSASIPAITTATTLPSSPVGGQECILVNSLSAPTYRWHFMYNPSSGSSYKWECIGGSWALFQTDALESTTSATPVSLTTVGPDFTTPYAGDWIVRWGHRAGGTDGHQQESLIVDGTGTTNIITGSVRARTGVTSSKPCHASCMGVAPGLASGAIIRMKYQSPSSSSTSFRYRQLQIMPQRLG